MSTAASAVELREVRLHVAALAGAVLLAMLAGALAVVSFQAAIAIALLVLLLAIRTQSRPAGLAILWAFWLLMPLLRRLLDLVVTAPGADPLSLLPFVSMILLAAMELYENRLDRRARFILAMASIGTMLGVPVGLLTDPTAALFGAAAYGGAVSAFVLGWGDGVRPRTSSTLYRALAIALLPLSVYALAQYFLPLASWDSAWVETGDLVSLGAPFEEDHLRVFSALNSPFTFSVVLVVGILLGLGVQHRRRIGVAVTGLMFVALALTYVRSAWLALAIGLLAFVVAERGRTAARILATVAVCVLGLFLVGDSNPTTHAVAQRITSLGSPEEDVSAQARLETTEHLLPTAVHQPLGAGIGQAGLAVRLEGSTEEQLVSVDDGYLSLMFQSGLFGLMLVLAALGGSLFAAVKALGGRAGEDRRQSAAVFAALVALLIALAAGDVLYGLPGAMLWYVCGLAVASASSRSALQLSAQRPTG